ncbi:hypothetical protein SELMODRAFT_415001 [Selaginella moellendorffii]|uniref:Uncharacterized protein n=1 Tax=Selaginella moellendorffii TaxID=88036 RepID=D8RUA3_SELML|nr:hypothetical protein SELMODRAFT_415001 [Selaginella moellendorffii]
MAPQMRLHCRCQKCTLGGLIPEGTIVCLSTYRNHEKGKGVTRKKTHRLPCHNGQEIIHCKCPLCAIDFGAAGRPFTTSGLLLHLRRNQARIDCSKERSAANRSSDPRATATAAVVAPTIAAATLDHDLGDSLDKPDEREINRFEEKRLLRPSSPESSCGIASGYGGGRFFPAVLVAQGTRRNASIFLQRQCSSSIFPPPILHRNFWRRSCSSSGQ